MDEFEKINRVNYIVPHPTDKVSVDLEVFFDENGFPYTYEVIYIWDDINDIEFDKSTFDLKWMTLDYLEQFGYHC